MLPWNTFQKTKRKTHEERGVRERGGEKHCKCSCCSRYLTIFWLSPVCQSLHGTLRIRYGIHSVFPPEPCYVLKNGGIACIYLQDASGRLNLENLPRSANKTTIKLEILKIISEE